MGAAEPSRALKRVAQVPGPVAIFACFVAFLVLVAAYATGRGGWVDELGFQNPPYMLAHFGKLTFPPSRPAGLRLTGHHPPAYPHVLIGTLCRLGLGIINAEATPTVLLLC